MPRRLLIGSSVRGTSSTAPAPSVDPDKIVFALPTIDDATVMQMRPSLKAAAQVVVDPAGHGDYTTLADAFADVENRRAITMAIAGVTTVDPRFRVDIGLAPSATPYTLSGSGTIPQFVGLYALDGKRGATEIRWGTEPGGYCYVEGISITNVDNAGAFDPKYAVHYHAYGTGIFTRGTWKNEAPKAGGYPTPIGMDGGKDQTLVMHDMTFASGRYTNLHGWPEWGNTPSDTTGMTVVFSKVTFPQGVFYYDAQNDVTRDELWVVDSTGGEWGLGGAATLAHLGGSTFTRDGDESRFGIKPAKAGATVTGTTDARRDWPIPTGGMSAAERAAWKARGVSV